MHLRLHRASFGGGLVFRGSASRPRSGTLSSYARSQVYMGGRSFGSSADRANTDLHSGSLIESQPQFRAGLPSELEVGFQPSHHNGKYGEQRKVRLGCPMLADRTYRYKTRLGMNGDPVREQCKTTRGWDTLDKVQESRKNSNRG